MIRVAAAAYPITFHSSFENWQMHVRQWVQAAVSEGADLLLFPEYASMELVSIFSEAVRSDLHLQLEEIVRISDAYCATFKALAEAFQCVIVAPSVPVADGSGRVNRVFVFGPEGQSGYQDKWMMTRFETEEWGVNSGEKVLSIFHYKGVRFGIQICYDVEFSIGSKHLADAGAQIILAPSCTETLRSATRVHIGARSRALEQQVYTVVAQTIGNAAWSPAVDINYGYAAFYSTPDGNFPEEGVLLQSAHQQEGWTVFSLDTALVNAVRKSGSVLNFQGHQAMDMQFRAEPITVREVRL